MQRRCDHLRGQGAGGTGLLHLLRLCPPDHGHQQSGRWRSGGTCESRRANNSDPASREPVVHGLRHGGHRPAGATSPQGRLKGRSRSRPVRRPWRGRRAVPFACRSAEPQANGPLRRPGIDRPALLRDLQLSRGRRPCLHKPHIKHEAAPVDRKRAPLRTGKSARPLPRRCARSIRTAAMSSSEGIVAAGAGAGAGVAADIGQDLPAAQAFLPLGLFEHHADAGHLGQAERLLRHRIAGQHHC